METNFTKDDLRNGDKVVTRDGRIWLMIKDCNTLRYGRQSFILLDLQANYGFMVSSSYDMGLMHRSDSETDSETDRDFDIMKVYRDGDEGMSGLSIRNDVHSYDLIWSREQSNLKTNNMETKDNFIKALSNDMPNYFANNCDMYNLISCAGYTKPLTAEQADSISALLAFAYDDYKAQLEYDEDDDAAFFEIQDNAAAEIANYLYVDNITVEPKLAAFLQAEGAYDEFMERARKHWGGGFTITSINGAFVWDDEEVEKWSALHRKWRERNGE